DRRVCDYSHSVVRIRQRHTGEPTTWRAGLGPKDMRRPTRRSLAVAAGCTALLVLLTALPAAAQSVRDEGDLAALRGRVSDLSREARFAEAAAISERALALAERRLGPRDPDLAEPLCDLAYLFLTLRP